MKLLKASNNSILWRLISVSTIIFLSSVGFVWAAANNNTLVKNAPKHSFNFQNEPFESVCKTISRATGYKIKFDDNFSKLPVTANFEETTAFGALKKILRVQNHSLVLNEENRSIEVFIVPSVDFSARKRLAALPPQNEGSATETQPEDMNESIENNDPTAAEAMEAYAQEYIMQTTAGEEADVIEADDINEYAEEYISRSKADEPVAIEAESMEAYAQEYIKQTSPGKDPDFVGATDINSYAEAYIDHVSKNDKISSPIIASDINEYADEYIRRQREGNFEE